MRSKILSFLILSFIFQIKVYGQTKLKTQGGDGDPRVNEKVSINGIDIQKGILKYLEFQTKRKFEPLKFYEWKDSIIDTTNYGHWDTISHGVFFKNIEGKLAKNIQYKYSSGLNADGLYIYLTNFNLEIGIPTTAFYDIAIIKASNQFEALKRVGTNSLNYDITNDEIIEKLKKWDSEFGLKITIIDKNIIQASILNKPQDIIKLANEIDEFSPDAKKHYGSLEVMIVNCLKQNELLLWWD